MGHKISWQLIQRVRNRQFKFLTRHLDHRPIFAENRFAF
jgi:hypothetical protein